MLDAGLAPSMKRADIIVTDSEFSKREIIKYFPQYEAKIRVVPCGVDLERFKPCEDENRIVQVKEKLNIEGDYFLYLGTIEPRKNLERLITAYNMFIKDMENPVLLSGTDGCGTKVKLAFIMDKHDTIGIDCVAMCVNDVACAGGEPLFFLDYIACGKNEPEKIATIVKGVAEGCKLSGCALVGGETAEHPGLMPEDEYDLAGFSVGVVDEKDLITGKDIKAGDTLVAIKSSGVHSNGFSLVRKVFEMTKESLDTYYDELGTTLGEALLAPTIIYVKALKSVKDAGVRIKGCSHITGGGFYENIPRMLPEGISAEVRKDSYEVPALFKLMAAKGNIDEQMMYNTFNMGVGMILAVDPADADKTIEAIKAAGEEAFVIGKTVAGDKGVTIC
jgi:phosphoribosylformylglycinamidine cyclo-ligase